MLGSGIGVAGVIICQVGLDRNVDMGRAGGIAAGEDGAELTDARFVCLVDFAQECLVVGCVV
jgi:hypothetical protein